MANESALSRLAGSYTRTTSDRDDLFQKIAMAIWKTLPAGEGNSNQDEALDWCCAACQDREALIV